MPERRTSLMTPRMESLLERVDSKFTLVTLSAMRAREINDYYNQLGEGLGKIVPPQVNSVSRKPLSISLEEIEVGKIEAVPLPEEVDEPRPTTATRTESHRGLIPPPTASAMAPKPNPTRVARPACRARCVWRYRRVQGHRSVSPARRRRRVRHAGAHRGLVALRRRAHLLGARVGAGAHVAVRRARAHPAHAARAICRSDRGRAGDREAAGQVRRRDLRRSAHRDAARDPCAGARRTGDAHRDVGAPRSAGQHRDAAPPRRPHGRPRERATSPAATRERVASPSPRPSSRRRRTFSAQSGDFAGVRVLVTAGGTREPIDAVRVITNRSSGKQGYAVAEVAARRGAAVTLVTTIGRPAPPSVEIVNVQTAAEMQEAVLARAADMDVIVQAAAVADFRPKEPPEHKLKKDEGIPDIVLEPTHDFSIDLGRAKRPGQVLVGFAAETNDLVANAAQEARVEAPRPHRRQQRRRARRRIRSRHQPCGHPRRGGWCRAPSAAVEDRPRRGASSIGCTPCSPPRKPND